METAKLEKDLSQLFAWAKKMQLTLAIEKCVVLHLGGLNSIISYKVNGVKMNSVDCLTLGNPRCLKLA